MRNEINLRFREEIAGLERLSQLNLLSSQLE